MLSDVKQASVAATFIASPCVLAFAAATLAHCFLLALVNICVQLYTSTSYFFFFNLKL